MAKVKAWDLFVRLFHWSLVLLVLGSFLTGEDELVGVHVRIGLAMVALVAARIVWGFLGPANARFSAFVRRPREVVAYARELFRGRPTRHLSHNPLAGAMVVTLIAVLLGLAATGALVAAGPEVQGPSALLSKDAAEAFEDVHEALSAVLVALVAAHLIGVVVSSVLERQNLVRGMITGWKQAPASEPAPNGPAMAATPRARIERNSNFMRTTLFALAAAAVAVLLSISAAHARDPRRGRDDDHRGRGGDRARSVGTIDPEYAKACGACHVAYPPSFLPAEGWRFVFAGLDSHFGRKVELDADTRAKLEAWAVSRGDRRPGAGASQRITEQPWFLDEHDDDVPPGVLQHPDVRSFSNCAGCHPGAASWDFDDDRLRMPRP